MLVVKQIKDDVHAATRIRLPWWAVLCVIIIGALGAWLFDSRGRLDLLLPTLNSSAVIGFVVAVKGKLKRRGWFWITIGLLAALHLPLILFVPWTTKWVPAITIAAIDSADLIAVITILSLVGRFFERRANR
jgi:hypothetical protein